MTDSTLDCNLVLELIRAVLGEQESPVPLLPRWEKGLGDEGESTLTGANLVNGGVTILAIVALTYFTKTLIESIVKILALKHPRQ